MSLVSLGAILRVARTGMAAQETNMSVIANNLANANTVGYKQSRAVFHELLDEKVEEPEAGNSRFAAQGAGTYLAATQKLLEQGTIEASSYQWDMAIEGEGYFRVQMADGTIGYTRDGTFRLDSEGRLTTADGNFLLPSVALPPDTEETTVTSTGQILVRRTGESEPYVLATMMLARFTDPSALEDVGNNIFQVSEGSGEAILGTPGANGCGQVIGYALEKSNVELSQQMVDMITSQRAYTLMARVIQTSDDMMGMAIHLRS